MLSSEKVNMGSPLEAFGIRIRIREALLLLLAGSILLNVLLVTRLHGLEANETTSHGNKSIFANTEFQYNSKVVKEGPGPTAYKRKQNLISNDGLLNCNAYDGPSDEDAAEMIYWRNDVPAEKQFQSVYGPEAAEKYFVFEPDEAGFSNVRLSFETVVALSRAMGRTLVMIPTMRFSQLLHQHPEGIRSYAMTDFFHISNVPIISMQDYLERIALQEGRLRDANGIVTFPPYNRTIWDGLLGNSGNPGIGEAELFFDWVSKSMPAIDWKRDDCVITFPSDREKGIASVRQYLDLILQQDAKTANGMAGRIKEYSGHPIAVNSSTRVRFREMLGERKELCEYNETWQMAESIYMTGHERTGSRPLIQFFGYLFFEDWQRDLQMKRFIRDNLRFSDIIQCAAARIVLAIREIAANAGGGNNEDGSFDTMHVRRTDFKDLATYKEGTDGADRIIADRFFEDKRTVYIATDEKDMTFFEPLRHHYNILFLNDFDHLIKGMDPNFFGMIEQLVCARGDKFVGTYYSTFTAYANRVRGYHAQKSQSRDSVKGIINSEYLGHNGAYRDVMKMYNSAHKDFWSREWPIGWRDIDHDVGS